MHKKVHLKKTLATIVSGVVYVSIPFQNKSLKFINGRNTGIDIFFSKYTILLQYKLYFRH